MYNFHRAELEDVPWLKTIFKKHLNTESCGMSPFCLLTWSKGYGLTISKIEDCLVIRKEKNRSGEISESICEEFADEYCFGIPIGENSEAVLKKIVADFDYPNLFASGDKQANFIKSLFPNQYNIISSRDTFDYIYKREDLAELKGKKYHSKRNHISYFINNFNWTYEEMSSDNISECRSMNEIWFEKHNTENLDVLNSEKEYINFAFDHFDLFELKGGVLRVDGKVIAFALGEALSETVFDTRFEKAFSDIRGAYQMINMMFARESLNDFELINREDDGGNEALRKAKMSYKPCRFVENFIAYKNKK